MRLELHGLEEINARLSQLSAVEWAGLKAMQGADMKNRANTITPYKSGDLRKSAYFDGVDTFGYSIEYAPHVNYGHRICRPKGQQVGYVEGQHFLEANVNAQEPIYVQDVRNWLMEKLR